MASHGYKDYRCSTLCEVKNWIDLALTLDPSLEVNSYEDLFKVGLRQHRQDLKETRLSMLERSLAIVRDFDLFGKYPSRMKFDAKKVLEEYCHLPLQFKQIASYHFENGSRTGRTIETIIREYRSLLRFFFTFVFNKRPKFDRQLNLLSVHIFMMGLNKYEESRSWEGG